MLIFLSYCDERLVFNFLRFGAVVFQSGISLSGFQINMRQAYLPCIIYIRLRGIFLDFVGNEVFWEQQFDLRLNSNFELTARAGRDQYLKYHFCYRIVLQ